MLVPSRAPGKGERMQRSTPRIHARAATALVQARSLLLKTENELAMAISILEELHEPVDLLRSTMRRVEQARLALVSARGHGDGRERAAS